MRRFAIVLVGLIALFAIGLVAWFVLPQQLARNEERQACEAVYNQLRRQINDPAFAKIDTCDEATIVPGEPHSYMVTAYYESNGNKYLFAGQAWKSANGWEATVSPPSRVMQ